MPIASPAEPASPRPLRPETRRAYDTDLRQFRTWCAAAGRTPLPVSPATLAAWLASLAELSVGGRRRKFSAVADWHRREGIPWPSVSIGGLSLTKGSAAAATEPVSPRAASRRADTPAQLQRLAAACPRHLAGRRDRALLLLRAAGLTRIDLVELTVEQMVFTNSGLELVLPPLDPAVPPRRLPLRRSPGPLCPVRALEEWLRASETQFGPVFRKIDRWGNVEFTALNVDALRKILARLRPRGSTLVRPPDLTDAAAIAERA